MAFRITGPARQRGGSFKVSGWLALLMLAVIATEGLLLHEVITENNHLKLQLVYHNLMSQPTTTITADPDADKYVTHCLPDDCEVCEFGNNVCFISI